MSWTAFALNNWKWLALAALLLFVKRSCNQAEKAYRWEQAYEAQQEVYSSTARRVVVTGKQLRNENKALLDSLKVRPKSVEFVYQTKWKTTTDTFPVMVYTNFSEIIDNPCPGYTLVIDTLCTTTSITIHPDSLNAQVSVESYGDLTAVGYWKRPGKWFGGKLWNAILGRKEAYIRITSPCFTDTAITLNQFKQTND